MREAESSAAVVAQPGRQGLTASQCAFERPLVDDGDLVAALSALRRDVMLGRIGTKVALTALAISRFQLEVAERNARRRGLVVLEDAEGANAAEAARVSAEEDALEPPKIDPRRDPRFEAKPRFSREEG
jgi:hypothetical protein